MRVNTKSGWFKLSVVLVSVAFIYVSCNFRPIFLKPKFQVWQPKQLGYVGELKQKWSFNLPSKDGVSGYVRKDSWIIATGNSTFKVSEKGIKKNYPHRFYGVDDANSSARIEYFHGSMGYFDNPINLIPYWFRFKASEMLVAKDDYIVMFRGNNEIYKIDINSGALLWQYIFPDEKGFLLPTFCVAGDKVALNAYFKNVEIPSVGNVDLERVILLDIETGQEKIVETQEDTVCTQFNDELYLIMGGERISKFDTQKMELTGKTIAIDSSLKDGFYSYSPFLHWFKASNINGYSNALINPIKMELDYKNVRIRSSYQYLYSNYLICFAQNDDHITGIDAQTFKETWTIPTKNLTEDFRIILGDERGILIHDDDKLICFGPP